MRFLKVNRRRIEETTISRAEEINEYLNALYPGLYDQRLRLHCNTVFIVSCKELQVDLVSGQYLIN